MLVLSCTEHLLASCNLQPKSPSPSLSTNWHLSICLEFIYLVFSFSCYLFLFNFGVNSRKHISNLLSSTLKHSHFPFSLVFSFPHFLACSLLLSTSFYLVTLIVWLYCWLGARSRTPVSNLSFSFSILSRSFEIQSIHFFLRREWCYESPFNSYSFP